MKKIMFVIAAAAAIFVTAPVSTPAEAQSIVIGNGANRDYGYRRDRVYRGRAEYRRNNYRRNYVRRGRGGPAIVIRP